MREPLRPDLPGPVSGLYGRGDPREGPLSCACGLAFDTMADRDAHWARPMRCGPGHPKGRRVRHGDPRLPGTLVRTFGAGPMLRSGEAYRAGPHTDWRPPPPDAPRPRVRVVLRLRLLREPRRRRRPVRVHAPTLPASDAWRARGKATPRSHHPPPPLPPPPEPRDWTLAPGADVQPGRVTHGLVTATPWTRVSASNDDAADAWPTDLTRPTAARVRWPATVTVRTADPGRVTALRRQWARPGRWCLVDARPDAVHGQLWRVIGGRVVRPDARRRVQSSQMRATTQETTIILGAKYSSGYGETR